MCCPCCRTVKEAATWGAIVHFCVGFLLLVRYFVIEQELGDTKYLYLAYVNLVAITGLVILLGVVKDIGVLVKGTTVLFIFVQIYGAVVRFIIPSYNERLTQRIGTGAFGVILTVIYIIILFRYARKCSESPRDAV